MADTYPEHLSLLEALKQTAKARGQTYADIAATMGCAEITVKRFFSGNLGAFHHAYAMCEAIGISFFDAAALAQSLRPTETVMSLAQDAYFAARPARFALFIEFYRRKPKAEIRRDWKLSEEKLFRFLRDCERLGLLDLFPGGKIRFRTQGPLLMHPQGKLRNSFLEENLKFLKEAQAPSSGHLVKTSEVLLTPAHAEELRAELSALASKWRAQAHADETLLPKHKTHSVRWVLACGAYQSLRRI